MFNRTPPRAYVDRKNMKTQTDFQKAKAAANAAGVKVGNPYPGPRGFLLVRVNMKAMNVGDFIRQYLPTPEKLAKEFAYVLKVWLSIDQQARVLILNKAEQNPSICHSHDFCDANQAMIDALKNIGIESDCQSDEQMALINEAWDIAKRNGFWFAKEVQS
jgi:hypothetical protein